MSDELPEEGHRPGAKRYALSRPSDGKGHDEAREDAGGWYVRYSDYVALKELKEIHCQCREGGDNEALRADLDRISNRHNAAVLARAYDRLADMARQRSQSPAETLSAALDALAPPTGGTPREHAREALRTMLIPPDDSPGELRIVEDAIRAAAQPLVDALEQMRYAGTFTEEYAALVAKAALAAWEEGR